MVSLTSKRDSEGVVSQAHQVVIVPAGEAPTAGLLKFLFQETINNPSLKSGENQLASQVQRRWEVWGEVREYAGKVRGWTWNPSNRYGSAWTVLKREMLNPKVLEFQENWTPSHLPSAMHSFNSSMKFSSDWTFLGYKNRVWVNKLSIWKGRSFTLWFFQLPSSRKCLPGWVPLFEFLYSTWTSPLSLCCIMQHLPYQFMESLGVGRCHSMGSVAGWEWKGDQLQSSSNRQKCRESEHG